MEDEEEAVEEEAETEVIEVEDEYVSFVSTTWCDGKGFLYNSWCLLHPVDFFLLIIILG